MKKIILLVLMISFFSLTNESFSQSLLTKFKAKAGYAKVIEHTKSLETPMVNPKLQLIGSTNITIPFGEFEIPIEIDVEKGTATGWLYVIRDKADTSKSGAYFAIKPILGDFLIIEIPGMDFGGFGLEIDQTLFIDDYEWIDTDIMVNHLQNESDFKEFYSKNKPFNTIFVGLFAGISPFNPEAGINPQWAISIANDDYQKACVVHAVSGEVNCTPVISGINEINYSSLEFYPNPANETLKFSIDSNISENTAFINDVYGRNVLNFNIHSGENSIDISQLATGVYYLKTGNRISKFIKQ